MAEGQGVDAHGQDAGLSVDDASEDGVVLGLRHLFYKMSIAQEAGLVGVRVMHLDGEGDRDIKGHQILGDAAHKRAAAVSLHLVSSMGVEALSVWVDAGYRLLQHRTSSRCHNLGHDEAFDIMKEAAGYL